MQLSYRLKGKIVKVIGIDFHDNYVLHKINNIGIAKGTILHVLDYNKNDALLHLLVYGVEYVLREKDCRYINVREWDNKQFTERK